MKNTALVVIDLINDIVHPDGKISSHSLFISENHVIEKNNTVINYARKNQLLIIFVRVVFDSLYRVCSPVSPVFQHVKKQNALQLNTWGTKFHDKLDKQGQDIVIEKHRISAFYSTPLEMYLKCNKVENILITGVSTDLAIESTAREAHDRDYKVSIIEDACGASSKDLHENSLKIISKIATVISSSQFDL
jgi:nicotinamidase-related amidase